MQAAEMFESYPVEDVFVQGLGSIEMVGVNVVRLTFYVEVAMPGGGYERRIKARMLWPLERLLDARAIVGEFLARGRQHVAIEPSPLH